MILVDRPRWTWKGQLWGHMVSDVSLQELHAFALQIGKRRIGFQGDHYDLNEDEHQLAVESGAIRVDSRELVRRLRDSGLRYRSSKPPWGVVYESRTSQTLSDLLLILSEKVSSPDHHRRLNIALMSGDPQLEVRSVLIVEHMTASAVVLELKERPYLDATELDLLIENDAAELRVVELIIGDC